MVVDLAPSDSARSTTPGDTPTACRICPDRAATLRPQSDCPGCNPILRSTLLLARRNLCRSSAGDRPNLNEARRKPGYRGNRGHEERRSAPCRPAGVCVASQPEQGGHQERAQVRVSSRCSRSSRQQRVVPGCPGDNRHRTVEGQQPHIQHQSVEETDRADWPQERNAEGAHSIVMR